MNNKTILSMIFTLLISGCSTMHFDKGEKSEAVKASQVTESWHHNFFFALFEASSPSDPIKECNNAEWSSVKTEVSFINGLTGGLVNGALMFPLWEPQTVEISCQKAITK